MRAYGLSTCEWVIASALTAIRPAAARPETVPVRPRPPSSRPTSQKSQIAAVPNNSEVPLSHTKSQVKRPTPLSNR